MADQIRKRTFHESRRGGDLHVSQITRGDGTFFLKRQFIVSFNRDSCSLEEMLQTPIVLTRKNSFRQSVSSSVNMKL